MGRKKKLSRLSPGYLALRHAGVFCMLAALGLLAGVAYRSLLQPTRYWAGAEVVVSVVPPAGAERFDWDGKQAEWRSILQNPVDRGLLGMNLRHALKLAVTLDLSLDTETLPVRLSEYDPQATYSASLFSNPIAARLGPTIAVSRGELAANLDFQSLAAIVSDLDPPGPGVRWDFSFFQNTPVIAVRDGLVINPGPDDRHFRVFYYLYSTLNSGRPAPSPLAAWRAAVDELSRRLDREAELAGRGGFGHTAKRELIREMAAIPALAANGLYRASGWFSGENDRNNPSDWSERWSRHTVVELRKEGETAGVVSVSTEMELHPLAFPRDTVLTRVPPLCAATLLSFLDAREEALARREEPPAVLPAPIVLPATQQQTEPAADLQDEAEATREVAYREVVDEAAAKARLDKIAFLAAAAKAASTERDAGVRRLDLARANENRLTHESIAARKRADRLKERHEEAVLASAKDAVLKIPPETAALFARRDALLKRLAELLTYCTEEHPFVKEVRRELAGLEGALAAHHPDEAANREAEERAVRAANLFLEWESALENADSLEERLRRQSEAVACLLDDVVNLETCLSQRDLELAQLRESPVPTTTVAVAGERRRTTRRSAPVAEPTPAPAPAPFPAPQPARPEDHRLDIAPAPTHIALHAFPPSWLAAFWGLLAGLILGTVWVLLREATASRFADAYEARRLVKLPVLVSLPAYDSRSHREAARTLKGNLTRSRLGRLQFLPAPIELAEPPPVARRGSILPARKRPHFLSWIFALAFLLLSGLLYYKTSTGFARPEVAFRGELPLPTTTVRIWADENEKPEEWGNQP